MFIHFYGANTHTHLLDEATISLANSLSLDPSMDDINKMDSSCDKRNS